MLDVCDADVSKLCLADKGLDTHRVGEIRRCLVGFVAPQSPPDSGKVPYTPLVLQAPLPAPCGRLPF